jgi:hypothetical protein
MEMGLGMIRVKRQFFVGSVASLGDAVISATIWCEDEDNAMLQVPHRVYMAMGHILGDRFQAAVRYC